MLRLVAIGFALASGFALAQTCPTDWKQPAESKCASGFTKKSACPTDFQRQIPGPKCPSGFTKKTGNDGCVCKKDAATPKPTTPKPTTPKPSTTAKASRRLGAAPHRRVRHRNLNSHTLVACDCQKDAATTTAVPSAATTTAAKAATATTTAAKAATATTTTTTTATAMTMSAADLAKVATEIKQVSTLEAKIQLGCYATGGAATADKLFQCAARGRQLLDAGTVTALLELIQKSIAQALFDGACGGTFGSTDTKICYASECTKKPGYDVCVDATFNMDTKLGSVQPTAKEIKAMKPTLRELTASGKVELVNTVDFKVTYKLTSTDAAAKAVAATAMKAAAVMSNTKATATKDAFAASSSTAAADLGAAVAANFAKLVEKADPKVKTAGKAYQATIVEAGKLMKVTQTVVQTTVAPAAPAASSASSYSLTGFSLAVGMLLF